MPATLKLNASVPTGENSMWFFPIESKYAIAWSRATFDGSYTCGGNVVDTVRPKKSTAAGSRTPIE